MPPTIHANASAAHLVVFLVVVNSVKKAILAPMPTVQLEFVLAAQKYASMTVIVTVQDYFVALVELVNHLSACLTAMPVLVLNVKKAIHA